MENFKELRRDTNEIFFNERENAQVSSYEIIRKFLIFFPSWMGVFIDVNGMTST